MKSIYNHTKQSLMLQVANSIIQHDYTVKDNDAPIINKLPTSKRIQIKPKENIVSEYNVIKRCVTEQRRSSGIIVIRLVTEPSINEFKDVTKLPAYCFKWLNYKYQKKVLLKLKQEFPQLQAQYNKILEIKPNNDTIQQIEKDLSRTIRAENNQQQIKNILVAYSVYDPNIGYVQGMNYIASILYNHSKQEWASFWLLVSLIEQMEVRDIFQLSLNAVTKYTKILDFLIYKFMPKLYNSLALKQVNTDLYLQQWLLSLLLQFIPFEYSQMYLDGLFKQGITYFYMTALTIIKTFENSIIDEDQIEILILLTSKQYSQLKWASVLALQWELNSGELRVLLDSYDMDSNSFKKPKFQIHNSHLINQFFTFNKL